jgi:CTP:phosphocholine cytidylyltransferase-like protein
VHAVRRLCQELLFNSRACWCGVGIHVGDAHVAPRRLKQPKKLLRGVNQTVSIVRGIQYLSLWLEVEIRTTTRVEGYRMDFREYLHAKPCNICNYLFLEEYP